MVSSKDFNSEAVGIDMGAAKALLGVAFEAAGRKHPVPITMVVLAMGYGIDSYGSAFMEWDPKVQGEWIREMVHQISSNTVDFLLKLEGEGKAGSLRRERGQDHVGKEIPNV